MTSMHFRYPYQHQEVASPGSEMESWELENEAIAEDCCGCLCRMGPLFLAAPASDSLPKSGEAFQNPERGGRCVGSRYLATLQVDGCAAFLAAAHAHWSCLCSAWPPSSP